MSRIIKQFTNIQRQKSKFWISKFSFWNKNYDSLPLFSAWSKIKDKIVSFDKAEEKKPCYIISFQNNIVVLEFRNEKRYELSDPNLAIFWNDRLYFIENYSYVDHNILHVRVEAKLDYIYTFYSKFLDSSGYIEVKKSPLFLKDDSVCRDICLNKTSKNNNSIYEWKTQTQPKYHLFSLDSDGLSWNFNEMHLGGGDEKGRNKFSLISDLRVKRVENWGWFQSMGTNLVFISHDEYLLNNSSLLHHEEKEELWNLPSNFTKQPHLLYNCHSIFQLFYLNKLIFSCFIKDLDIIERKVETPDDLTELGKEEYSKTFGDKQYAIRFKIRTICTPAGVFYTFISGHSRHKWELDVRQKIVSFSGLKKFGANISNLLGKLASFWKGDIQDKSKILTAKKAFEVIGINEPPKDNPENEQQTERLVKTTLWETGEQISKTLPSIMYSSTIDFNYDFAEFATRYTEPILKARVEWDTELENNLRFDNNLASSLVNFNTTFNKLSRFIRKGFWQGNLRLNNDIDGFISSLFNKGIFFYEDKEKDFIVPSLSRIKRVVNIIKEINPVKVYVNEEVVETKHFREKINYDALKAEAFHKTFFCFDNREVQNSFRKKFNMWILLNFQEVKKEELKKKFYERRYFNIVDINSSEERRYEEAEEIMLTTEERTSPLIHYSHRIYKEDQDLEDDFLEEYNDLEKKREELLELIERQKNKKDKKEPSLLFGIKEYARARGKKKEETEIKDHEIEELKNLLAWQYEIREIKKDPFRSFNKYAYGWCWKCTQLILERINFFSVYAWKCPADCKFIMLLENDGTERHYELKEGVSYDFEFNPDNITISWSEIVEGTTISEGKEVINYDKNSIISSLNEIKLETNEKEAEEITKLASKPIKIKTSGIEIQKEIEKEQQAEKVKVKEVEATWESIKEKEQQAEKVKDESKHVTVEEEKNEEIEK